MFFMTSNGQVWTYDEETEQFCTLQHDGAKERVFRTYADWQRIFPA